MSLAGKVATATFFVIALGLILTRPSGFSKDVGAITSGYATDVGALYKA